MNDPNRHRFAPAGGNKTMLVIAAAIVVAFIVGALIYARNYSGNDTSPAASNTPPSRF